MQVLNIFKYFFRGAMEEMNGISSGVIPETTVFILINYL